MKAFTLLIGALLLGAAAAGMAEESTAPAPAAAAVPLPRVSPTDLLARLDRKDPDLVVLDVRTSAEFAAGHVPGARNVPHDELPSKLAELAVHKDKEVVLYCRSGRRSAIAGEALRNAGFEKLGHLEGDYLAWEAGKLPVSK